MVALTEPLQPFPAGFPAPGRDCRLIAEPARRCELPTCGNGEEQELGGRLGNRQALWLESETGQEMRPRQEGAETHPDDGCPDTCHRLSGISPAVGGAGAPFPNLCHSQPGSSAELTPLCLLSTASGIRRPGCRIAQSLQEGGHGVAGRGVAWASAQHAVSAVPQVPAEPDGARASLEQVMRGVPRRRDVWANTDGEGAARGLEPWACVDQLCRVRVSFVILSKYVLNASREAAQRRGVASGARIPGVSPAVPLPVVSVSNL